MVRYAFAVFLCLLGLVVASLAFAPSPRPMTDPAAQAILQAIDQNLAKATSLTANLQTVDTVPQFAFVNGTLQAKGKYCLRIDGGSASMTYVQNDTGHSKLQWDGRRGGSPWEDADGGGTNFISDIGLVDPRAILNIAKVHDTLTVQPGTVQVNGVTCRHLQGTYVEIWTDATTPSRLIACRLNRDVGLVRAEAVFSGWAARDASGFEFPNSVVARNYPLNHNGVNPQPIRTINYSLSNIQTGASLPDSVFNLLVTFL